MANLTVSLQNDKLTSAADGVTLATDQQTKASNLVDRYNTLIATPMTTHETDMLNDYKNIRDTQDAIGGDRRRYQHCTSG